MAKMRRFLCPSFLLATVLTCCVVVYSDIKAHRFSDRWNGASTAARKVQWRHVVRVGLNATLPYETIRNNAPWRLHGLDSNESGEHRDFIYFAHVPKTAGQSLSFFLFKSFSRTNATKPHNCLRNLKCAASKTGVAPRFDPNFAQSNKIPQQVFTNPIVFYGWANLFDVVLGHFDASWLRVMGNPGRRHHILTLTILRDPVERILSWFNYMRGKTMLSLQCIHLRRIKDGLFNVRVDQDIAWEAESESWRWWSSPHDYDSAINTALNPDAVRLERHARVVSEIRAVESDTTISKMCSRPGEQSRIKGYNELSAYSTKVNERLQSMMSKVGNVNTQFHSLSAKSRRSGQDNNRRVDVGSLPPMLKPDSLPITFTEWDFLNLLQKLGMDNYMARMFSGLTPWSLEGSAESLGISNEEMMAVAGESLRRFTFVGLSERFDDSIKMLSKLIDFPEKLPENAMKTKKNLTYKKREPPPGLKERIMEVEWMDVQLYQQGKTLFESRFSNFDRTNSKK